MLDKVRSQASEAKQVRSGSHLDASPWAVLLRLARERWREYAGRSALALLLMAIAAGATALSDTSVGELGSMISGGQRQRISIARAFLKNAPVLLLDEPTSALDSEAEKMIQEALGELMRGRTTIVIAHRFTTVLRAQCIYVIDRGLMVESGTHEELLRKGDCYARLYDLQFQDAHESRDHHQADLRHVT